jgi:hypothetical protein
MGHPWGYRGAKPKVVTEDRVYATQRRCKWCGRMANVSGMAYDLCTDCLHESEVAPRAYNEHRAGQIKVLFAPRDDMLVGKTFTRDEFRAGLRMGTWPPGMVVRGEDGYLVAVCAKGKLYRNPADVLPREWTRRVG